MKKILLIEDDAALRENLAEILVLSNYSICEASDGKEGVEKALRDKPDLILCDVSLPYLDGYGVLHVLSRHPDTFAIPFIFLSSRNSAADQRKAMSMGADDYLIKPVNESDLLDTIEMRLKKSEGLKRNVIPDKKGVRRFIQQANESESFNLTSGNRDVNQYKKKHILYSVGQRPMNVFFVVSGKIKEFLINEDGKELITNMYTQGDFFGYVNILEDVNYTETVQALDDSELILIPKVDFVQLISNDKLVAKQFISLLSHNIKEKEEKLLNLAYNSLRKKVAIGIVEVMDKFKDKRDGKPVVEISREDLANVIGSAQESMIRTLKEFRTEKLIDVVDGNILVLNENKLRHLLY